MSETYLGCVDAAKYLSMRPSAISNAMRRGQLQYVKVGRIRKTTPQFLEEYLFEKRKLEKKRNREGNYIYGKEKLTIREAAKELRTCTSTIYKYIRDGHITLGVFGRWYVVTQEQLKQIKQVRLHIRGGKKRL